MGAFAVQGPWHRRSVDRLQRRPAQNLHRGERPAGGHARWAYVHGANQTGFDRTLALVLVEHQAADGARASASATAHAERRNGGALSGTSLRGGGGGPPGRSAAVGRLWRGCSKTQRACGVAAFRRDGREV